MFDDLCGGISRPPTWVPSESEMTWESQKTDASTGWTNGSSLCVWIFHQSLELIQKYHRPIPIPYFYHIFSKFHMASTMKLDHICIYDMHQALSIILKFHRFMHLPYLIWNIQSGSPFCSSLMFHPGQPIFLDLKHARNKVHLALENSRSTTVRALRHIFQLPKLAKPATKMPMKWWNGHFSIQFMEVR